MNYQKMKMRYLYHFLTLFCCLTENVTFDTSELADVSSLSKLCPYTDYCTINASKRLQDTTEAPCCGYCSCADDCWKRGNCCVDKQTIITEQPTEPCNAVLVSDPENKYFDNNLPGYYITKSCPTRDDPLEEKCSGRRQPSIEDFIWVTDSRTHRIYNNKYCARCHGVNAYAPWFISTDCMEVLTGQNSPIDTINHIISNCSLFVAPTSIKDHKSRCFVPKITQCNMTGKAETYNQALESACNSFSQPYVEARFNRPPVYKNVYCFLCNWQHDLIVPDICMSDDTADRTSFARFTGIIDFTAIETVDKAVAHEAQGPGLACAIDEIGDPYQERCLKLSCPIKQTPVYGKCVSLISSTRFLNLRATFRLFPKWTKTDLPFDESNYHIESVAEKLIPKIRRKLGLQDGQCKPCEETIYGIYNEQNVPEMFSTDTRFYTSEHCQEDEISQRMNLLLQNQLKMMFGRDHVTLNVVADTPDEYDSNFINAPVRHYMTLKYCPRGSKTLDLNRLNGCPSVSLNQENYASLMQQAKDTSERRNINELFKFESNETKLFSITHNFTAQVCFESYLTVLPRENTGVAEISKTTPVLIIVLISIKSWIK